MFLLPSSLHFHAHREPAVALFVGAVLFWPVSRLGSWIDPRFADFSGPGTVILMWLAGAASLLQRPFQFTRDGRAVFLCFAGAAGFTLWSIVGSHGVIPSVTSSMLLFAPLVAFALAVDLRDSLETVGTFLAYLFFFAISFLGVLNFFGVLVRFDAPYLDRMETLFPGGGAFLAQFTLSTLGIAILIRTTRTAIRIAIIIWIAVFAAASDGKAMFAMTGVSLGVLAATTAMEAFRDGQVTRVAVSMTLALAAPAVFLALSLQGPSLHSLLNRDFTLMIPHSLEKLFPAPMTATARRPSVDSSIQRSDSAQNIYSEDTETSGFAVDGSKFLVIRNTVSPTGSIWGLEDGSYFSGYGPGVGGSTLSNSLQKERVQALRAVAWEVRSDVEKVLESLAGSSASDESMLTNPESVVVGIFVEHGFSGALLYLVATLVMLIRVVWSFGATSVALLLPTLLLSMLTLTLTTPGLGLVVSLALLALPRRRVDCRVS